MKTWITAGLAITLLAAAGCGQERIDPGAEPAAMRAADEWLKLVDAGQYAESWDAAAAYFKGCVKKDRWVETLQGIRTPLGKMLSRTVVTQQASDTLPGTPDGKYVLLQYNTKFEHKNAGIETITPMLDQDGTWRISGYYVR